MLLLVLGVAGLAGFGWLSISPPVGVSAQRAMNDPNRLMGWRVEEGRLAEGPYRGLLVAPPPGGKRIVKSEAEWRALLTPEQFRILRNQGTEPAFCGRFHDHKEEGYYRVVGTGQKVFRSDAKFDSGTGWPSFFAPYDRDAVWVRPDFSYGMIRMEVLATWCDGHLGHVFNDGPRDQGGLRFCINSEVLEFVPAKLD